MARSEPPGTSPFPAEHGRGEPQGRRALVWDARSPPHTGSHPVAGPHRRRALVGVQLGVCSATPSVPTEMPTSPWLPTDIPARLVNSPHGTSFRPQVLGVATPRGNVARAAPPARAGSGHRPRAPAQGAEPPPHPCQQPDPLQAGQIWGKCLCLDGRRCEVGGESPRPSPPASARLCRRRCQMFPGWSPTTLRHPAPRGLLWQRGAM